MNDMLITIKDLDTNNIYTFYSKSIVMLIERFVNNKTFYYIKLKEEVLSGQDIRIDRDIYEVILEHLHKQFK